MSSRYPPSRDRSPPRYPDRRPSGATTYRGSGDSTANTSDRAPPRGPKAETYRGGFQYPSNLRGRGSFAGRSNDLWDRDRERDVRSGSSTYRRENDRSDGWRRDRDLSTSERSSAPIARDTRPYVGRDRSDRSASPERARRGSKESLNGTFSRVGDNAPYYGPAGRGGAVRGRGRGDWDRSRGRNSFVGDRDRDLFFPRSRSREGWRDRESDRPRGTPSDGDRLERREYDRTRDNDLRPREHDIWSRERSPGRSSTGNLSARPMSPATVPPSTTADRVAKPDYDTNRRPSAVVTPAARRDVDSMDYFGARTETPRHEVPLNPPYLTPNSIQSASAAALDYGPPPTQQTAITPSAQERPNINKIAPLKPELEKSPQPAQAFQPPSGPKADRTSSQAGLQKTPQQHETWVKPEAGPRFTRPPTIATGTDNEVKASALPSDVRAPPIIAAERALPSNVPSGPRASSGQFRPRLGSLEPVPTFMPPTAPKESPKIAAKDLRLSNVPTGPRLDREKDALQSRTLPGPASRQWIAPELKAPTKPSIMNPLNKPYHSDHRDRSTYIPTGPRQNQANQSALQKTRSNETAPSMPRQHDHADANLYRPSQTARPLPEDVEMKEEMDPDIAVSAGKDVDVNMQDSSDDAEDDDGIDEEYFAECEESHRSAVRLLEAKKPPPLLQDPVVVGLLFRITFLEMLADEAPMAPEQEPVLPRPEIPLEGPKLGLPSPDHDSQDIEHKLVIHQPRPRGRPLKEAPIHPIPTPPQEALPYLKDSKRILPFTTFDESDDEVEHEAMATLLGQEFEQAAFEWQDKLEELKAAYRDHYGKWKSDLYEIQKEKDRDKFKHLDESSPAPASPAPSVAPSITSTFQHERTRGGRNTTEADLEKAILLSQQTLAEEQERRDREAATNAFPNPDTEASVPSLMPVPDIELYRFEDTNSIVLPELAIDRHAYIEPEDDFTDEEQVAFIRAYNENPKRWGKIAACLPGRTYQECIIHYYLTKNASNYKEHLRRSQPKKPRRGRAAKPRSNNLMSELVYNEGADTNPATVTDSGRPRRAAAPTFGEAVPEDVPLVTLPAAKRLTAGTKEKEANGDPALTPKPRGRKAGAPKPRKTKAQVLAEQQQGPPNAVNVTDDGHKTDKAVARSRGQTMIRPEGAPRVDGPLITLEPQRMELDNLQQFASSDFLLPSSQSVNAHSAITSYWSVPEQQKFPKLLEYFGHDYTSIADFMKTKSPVMIKNYFARQINEGKTHLEQIADTADNKRQAGEPMGTIPSPIAPPKRRYEATPSAIPPRQIMQPVEAVVSKESESLQSSNKSTLIDEFPSNSIHRSATGEIVQKPRERHHPTPPLHPTLKVEGTPGMERGHMQKAMSGPRSGLFQDDPYISPLQRPLVSFHEPTQPPHSARNVDHPRGVDVPAYQGLGTPLLGRGMLAQMTEQTESTSQDSRFPQAEKYPPQRVIQPVHARNGSLARATQDAGQNQTQNPGGVRNPEPQFRGFFQAQPATASPGLPPMQQTSLSRVEPFHSTMAIPGPAEAPKPVPPKRSTLMSLLNDDTPEERPAKRSSIETNFSGRTKTPPLPPASMQTQRELLNQSRNAMRVEETHAMNRSIRPGYSEYSTGHSNTVSAAAPSNEQWIGRFDHRDPPAASDHRSLHHPPGPSAYSPLPSNSLPAALPNLQRLQATEPPRQTDQPRIGDLRADRHRSLLSGIDQPRLAPSPPPQQPSQQTLMRSTSGSSQHMRVSSLGYQPSSLGPMHTQQSHPVQSMRDQGPPTGYPFSNNSTPVSSLHQRSQPSSVDYRNIDPNSASGRALTIQQHMAQEQARSREHEPLQSQNSSRHRELLRHDSDQLLQQPSQQMLHHRARDSYGNMMMPQELRQAAHSPSLQSQQAQQHQAQQLSHHHQQQQHQHQHQPQPSVGGHSHLPYGPPGANNRTFTPPLPAHSMYHGQHQQPPQVQQPGPGPGIGPGASGHYRVLSQGGPGAHNERR